VTKRGAFYSYGDLRLGQGRENAKIFLGENPDIAVEIDAKVRGNFGLPVTLVPAKAAVEVDGGVEASDDGTAKISKSSKRNSTEAPLFDESEAESSIAA
jgi:hypothetical protein